MLGFTSGFLGTIKSINLTQSSNATDVNLFTLAGSPAVPVFLTYTINSGVILSASSTSTVALVVPAFPTGSKVTIINNGSIYGAGGAGGEGSTGVSGTSAGAFGGDAMSLGFNITINNGSGQIFGGGGGGAGGTGWFSQPPATGGAEGGGGGGGQGSVGGAGAPSNPGNPAGDIDGAGAGGNGSISGPGAGSSVTSPAESGGNGGTWGSNGGTHSSKAGGAAGNAIDLNGFTCSFTAGNDSTHIKGAVV